MASTVEDEITRRKRKKESLLPFPVPVEHLGQQEGKKERIFLHRPTRLHLLMVGITLLLLVSIVMLVASIATLLPHPKILITPLHSEPTQTIVMSAVTGTPDQGQLQALTVSTSTPAQQTSASATGHEQQLAQQASGEITFYNSNLSAVTVGAGVVFTANGIQIVTLAPVSVPPVIMSGTGRIAGQANVAAQAIQAGVAGNIPIKAIDDVPCCVAGITAQNNQAFSGGQDAATYTVVIQQDIDAAAAPIVQRETQTARADLFSKVKVPEQMAETSLICIPLVQANPAAGSRAEQTSISVSVSCQAETYNSVQASELASSEFLATTMKSLGPSYALRGSVWVGPIKASVLDQSTISITTEVSGQFVSRIDLLALKHLLPRIAGMTVSEAKALLSKQSGTGNVSIIGLSGDRLPSDVSQIEITIQLPEAARH